MADQERTYTNGEITVFWRPTTCAHSAICWKGLVQVFNPRQRPWVNINGASTAEIITQIDQCPSGALSWKYNADIQSTQEEMNMDTPVEITATKNGSLKVSGKVIVKDADGNVLQEGETLYLCRCGQSAKKPFCDGSHRKAGFEG